MKQTQEAGEQCFCLAYIRGCFSTPPPPPSPTANNNKLPAIFLRMKHWHSLLHRPAINPASRFSWKRIFFFGSDGKVRCWWGYLFGTTLNVRVFFFSVVDTLIKGLDLSVISGRCYFCPVFFQSDIDNFLCVEVPGSTNFQHPLQWTIF